MRETETDESETHIQSEIQPFIARRPEQAGGSLNNRIGTIQFDFFEVKYVKRDLVVRKRRHDAASNSAQGHARLGVLASYGCEHTIMVPGLHVHTQRNGRPLADLKRPLEVARCEITICEIQELTIGSFTDRL